MVSLINSQASVVTDLKLKCESIHSLSWSALKQVKECDQVYNFKNDYRSIHCYLKFLSIIKMVINEHTQKDDK